MATPERAPYRGPDRAPDRGRAAGPARPVRGDAWMLHARPGEALMLMPGQAYFGTAAASLQTLLGSCVAITLWHPRLRIGGMCHYLLPQRARRSGDPLDGRYGDEALHAMVQRLGQTRTDPSEYHAHLYGGADTMAGHGGASFNIGERNIEQGWRLIDEHGFQLQGVDVGEDIPRTVVLNLASGDVQMRRGQGAAPVHALPKAGLPRRAAAPHSPPPSASHSADARNATRPKA